MGIGKNLLLAITLIVLEEIARFTINERSGRNRLILITNVILFTFVNFALFGDFQNILQTNAGVWNGMYDAKKEVSTAKPTFNTQEMLNNVKSLKFTAPEWKFSLNQGNIGASTLGDLPSTKPESINLSQEFTKDIKLNIPNEVQTFSDLDWMKYAQQTGYIK